MASTDSTQLQLASLLGPNSTHFDALLSHLMSADNDRRSEAESLFNLAKQTHPDSLSLKLAHALSSSSTEFRALSAVLLRKVLTQTDDDDSFLFYNLTSETQNNIKSTLIVCLSHENDKSVIKKVSDTVSELASVILADDKWPELLPFVFQCVNSENSSLREVGFWIFGQLAQVIGETLGNYFDMLHSVFFRSLGSGVELNVRNAALGASVSFVQCLEKESERDRFRDLVPLMMSTLNDGLGLGEEASAQEALEMLIELAGMEPRFFRRQIVDVVGSMLKIAGAGSLEEGTRHLAVEFVITLAEARERAPGMMRKLPQFIRGLFEILMQMLLDIEDDPAWHSAVTEHEDAGETTNYSVGQECLDRLAMALGGNTLVPVASEVFPVYLAAPEWQKHHAALIALAQIAEGCSKVADSITFLYFIYVVQTLNNFDILAMSHFIFCALP